MKAFLPTGPAVKLALAAFALTAAPISGVGANPSAASVAAGAQTETLKSGRGLARRASNGRRRYRIHRWQKRHFTAPVRVNCVVQKDFDEGGSAPYPIIRIVNLGSFTIPAGYRFRWQLSTGKSGAFTLHHPLAPGQSSTAIDVPQHNWMNGLTCSAHKI